MSPKVGDVLFCEDGSAVVVTEGTTVTEGLLTLLEESYGGARFEPDNPAIVAALPDARIERWFSCGKSRREDLGIEDAFDWWSADGDGKRSIIVCFYERNVYDLGDDAAKADGSDYTLADLLKATS